METHVRDGNISGTNNLLRLFMCNHDQDEYRLFVKFLFILLLAVYAI